MKPAGTSCNIPIGQNPPTWRGNDIVLARPWPDDLVQCRSSCAGGGISACCSTPQPTGPRILVRPALVVECRIAAGTAMVSRPPPRLAHPLPNACGKPLLTPATKYHQHFHQLHHRHQQQQIPTTPMQTLATAKLHLINRNNTSIIN